MPSTCERAAHLSAGVALVAVLFAGAPLIAVAQFQPGEAISSDDQAAEPEAAEPEMTEPEAVREEQEDQGAETESEAEAAARRELKRTCQVCDHGLFSLNLLLPLWVPLVGVSAVPPDDTEDTGVVEFTAQLSYAFMGTLSLRVGPVTLEAVGLFLALGSNPVVADTGRTLGDIDLSAAIGRAQLKWNAPPIDLGSGPRAPRLALWPLAGVRVVSIHGSANTPGAEVVFEDDITWAEPVLGLETILDFRSGWSLGLEGSVGGFGIGSDLSAAGTLHTAYHFTHWFSIYAGYEVIYLTNTVDRAVLSTFELLVHGPVLGLAFSPF